MYKKNCLFLLLGAALLAHAEAHVRFLRDTTREIDLWQVFFANISDAEQTVTLANGGGAGRTVTLPPHALEVLLSE